MKSEFKIAKVNTMMFDDGDCLQEITKEVVDIVVDRELSAGMAKAILKDAQITVQGILDKKKL